MGKGDKKTKRGKIIKGSYGRTRLGKKAHKPKTTDTTKTKTEEQ